jgi:Hsp70 protein
MAMTSAETKTRTSAASASKVRQVNETRGTADTATGWSLAVDFGTTATAAAVRAAHGAVAGLVLANGGATMPSSVFADDGRLIVGTRAETKAGYEPDRYEPTPKRCVGRTRVLLGDKEYRPAELVAAAYASVIGEAMRQHGDTVPASLILTYPVAWTETRLNVLREAARLAGARLQRQLPEPQFVPEPVAAAAYYTQSNPELDLAQDELVAIYDLGGGTFDATVLRRTGADFEVLASGGIDPLGGFDFDNRLFRYLGTTHIEKRDPDLWHQLAAPYPDDQDIGLRRRALQAEVRQLKEALSDHTQQTIRLPGITEPVLVTRAELEALVHADLEATIGELAATIRRAGLQPDQLAGIYRIGGASRMPLVGSLLDQLQRPVRVVDHPKTVVSHGAAVRRRQPSDAPSEDVANDAGSVSLAEPADSVNIDATTHPFKVYANKLLKPAILVPAALAAVLLGVIVYATTEFNNTSGQGSTNPAWQPYVDTAIRVATDNSVPTRDGIQRLLNDSTGELHNTLVSRHNELEAQASQPVGHYAVDAAGLQSLVDGSADVLITSTMTSASGSVDHGITHVKVVKDGDAYKAIALSSQHVP